MKLRRMISIFFILTLVLLLVSCNNNAELLTVNETTTNSKSSITSIDPKPDSTLLPTTEPTQSKLLPRIDSSTARIPITEAIYKLFTDEYGYIGPEPLASKTHGAWLNLAEGKADIVFLVAPTKDELAYFTEKGVDIEMKIYGYDGLVFMGNESNPVQNLTVDQIMSIYNGKINNWKDVGGKNAKINAYIRDPESGSQRLFENLVWEGYDMPDFSSNFKQEEINSMGGVTHMVLDDPNAVGFNIMSYIESEFKNEKPKLFSINGYIPATKNFASGDYPFLTTSYVAIRADEPADSSARKLYDWIGSEESRKLISNYSTLTVVFSESVCVRVGTDVPVENVVMSDIILQLNQQIIQRKDLLQFTLEEIEYLRNGIYALSGKIFSTKNNIQYFDTQGWYKGTSESDDEVSKNFNDNQKKNLATILSYEKELKRALINQK